MHMRDAVRLCWRAGGSADAGVAVCRMIVSRRIMVAIGAVHMRL